MSGLAVIASNRIRTACRNGGELPLPLWERVGVRGYGLSIALDPSPGSHLTMRRSRSFASAFFPGTAAEGGLCLSHKEGLAQLGTRDSLDQADSGEWSDG